MSSRGRHYRREGAPYPLPRLYASEIGPTLLRARFWRTAGIPLH
jgi:hypothetical protein